MAIRTDVGARRATLTGPGIVLGAGLGAFIDGIALHQIAQWHSLLSSTERWPVTSMEGMKANMRADGLFHAFALTVVLIGLWKLWHALRAGAPGSGHTLVGWMLIGFGGFNIVEGIVDHHILAVHHVNEGSNELAWDLGFLALSGVLLTVGWLLARADELRTRRL